MPNIQIFSNEQWKECSPYIYHDGEWKETCAYIFHNNEWIEFSTIQMPLILFDQGYIDGINWKRNYFNLPEGSIAPSSSTDPEKEEIHYSGMWVYAAASTAAVNWSTNIKIPYSAKTINFDIGYYYASDRAYPTYQVGFLSQNASTMIDTSNGGLLTEESVLNNGTGSSWKFTTISLNIPSDFKGASNYRVIVNYLGSNKKGGIRSDFCVHKVWFE